ncbi:LacI family DNA-binding transcriptional regulator [Oscillospiraceae bacterium MB08-C2-2]|nr:LacI family DNA-binding transcriptional regulator [Oscillospiraceae bacterium MB08-C2-2]
MACTLKDIAQRAGVSTVTVHKSIYGKPGIGEATRKRVLEIVKEMNYSVNPVASSLKRDALNIAVISPTLESQFNYFFRAIDTGIQNAEKELRSFKVSVLRYSCGDTWQSQTRILDDILQHSDIHGVVIYCWDDTKLNAHFEKLHQKGIPVITFHSDAINSCRIACVSAPNENTGYLAAELMSHITPQGGRIIVMGGNKMLKVLRDNTLGFYSCIQRYRSDLSLLEINDKNSLENLKSELRKLFCAFDNIVGVYCNSARNNIPLCEVLHEMALNNKIKVICSDVFEELAPYFEDGTITATMWQDPQSQSYKAIKLMYEYLTTRTSSTDRSDVRIGIVMKSNFVDYLGTPLPSAMYMEGLKKI